MTTNNLGNEIYNAKLNPLQKELVRELIQIGNKIDFLLRNGTFPHQKDYDHKQELKQQLGLEEKQNG